MKTLPLLRLVRRTAWPALLLVASHLGAAVVVERLPEPGLQPQVLAASNGTVHLLYLTGDPKSSDIVYRRRTGETPWSEPVRVNSQPGSAIAIGTIRGPQMALGRNGRVHVIWSGSAPAAPKPAAGGTPLLYAQWGEGGTGFTPQRNLMASTHELDGGGSITADANGRVLALWHAATPGRKGETNRAVFLALSTDDGQVFAPERAVSPAGNGACSCCGLTALADDQGNVSVLYRTARTLTRRDMALLVSTDHGGRFRESFAQPWLGNTCPMSSAALLSSDSATLAVWESSGRIQLGRFSDAEWKPEVRPIGPMKGAKHPRLARNHRGEMLIVWTEGTGWQRGGALAWQMLDARGEPTAESGRRDGLAAWSYATAYARPNGDFVILH